MIQGGERGLRRPVLITILAVVTLFAGTACGGGKTGGTASGPPDAAQNVAGLPVTHFQSGFKANAPTPDVTVKNVTTGDDDKLATAAIVDVEKYWSTQLPANFGGQQFEPVKSLLSYDSNGAAQQSGCGSTKKVVNAYYCSTDDSVNWDRGVLLPQLRQQFGPVSVVTVLAHEFGHAIQARLGPQANMTKQTPTIVKEQQADCFAGNYFRYLAEDKSQYFQVSTDEGLSQVLAAMFSIRDPAGFNNTDVQAHGTAFDRVFAFQTGFEKTPKECAAMNQQNVQARIVEQPFAKGDQLHGQGTAKFNETAVADLQKSLDQAFTGVGAKAPQITAKDGTCPGGKSTPPATYCADTNTVSIDMAALTRLAQPVSDDGKSAGGFGDFAAFSEIASRYVIGVEKTADASVDNANAGLRTACLVGAWAKATNVVGQHLRLSPGDLDEAMTDLLQPNSLVAADANGVRPVSGFDRVAALRNGYLQGSPVCSTTYA
ncbi:MAG: aminopeptidase [Amycolatopsis sp.]|nr:aminopeptidase [Amycolatopsis sp.]